MKFAAMGAGAMGGYFGGRLASAGHDVTLIARGAHLNALRRNGLKILSPKGDLHIGDIVATSDPGEVGPVDVILFMVKNYDVADAARQIEPMIGPQTMCVTCQNGVSAPDRLADVVGAGHVVPGVAMIPAEVLEPGVIRHNGPLDTLRFGELDGTTTTRASAFATALEQGGCTADILPNIAEALWRKLVMQATLASVTTLLRLDLGPIRENPETAALCRAGITETFAVAHRLHPGLPDSTVDEVWDFMCSLPPTVHASMLDDLNRGKPLEIDYLSGDIVRIGAELGVPTPINKMFWQALQPFKNGMPS